MTTKTKTPAKNAKKTTAKKVVVKTQRKAAGGTFGIEEICAKHGYQRKTLRSRIRRNPDKWKGLFEKVDKRYVFKDTAAVWKRVDAACA